MFEGAVTVAYLKKHPSELDDYMEFVWISNRKLMNFLEEYDPEKLQEISTEARSRSDRELQRVKLRFTNSNGKIRPH
jgi:hypothetical protein